MSAWEWQIQAQISSAKIQRIPGNVCFPHSNNHLAHTFLFLTSSWTGDVNVLFVLLMYPSSSYLLLIVVSKAFYF